MKKIIVFIVLLFHLNIFSQEIASEDWITDINFLKTELEKKHKNLYFQLSEKEFSDELSSIKKNLDTDSDIETAIKLNQLIAKLGDSHTTINIRKFIKRGKDIPLGFQWFGDDLYITLTTKDYYDILDQKITAINNYKINRVVDSIKTLFTAENKGMIKARTSQFLNKSKVLSYFNFSKKSDSIFKIQTQDKNGNILEHYIHIAKYNRKNNIYTRTYGARPYYIEGKGKIFKEKYYPDSKIYYVQYNKCMSKESVLRYGNKENAHKWPSFNEFENKILRTLENENVEKFIFDMRFNKGGSSYLAQNLIKKIAKNKNINQRDKLFVVVGNATYSSAIWNTIDFKKWTNATIIGEETSGKPNHYGNVKSFYLPYSNMKVTFSTEYYKLWEENNTTIQLDVPVIRTFEHYKNGIDPILEYVENLNKM